jgi:hypothetical protein
MSGSAFNCCTHLLNINNPLLVALMQYCRQVSCETQPDTCAGGYDTYGSGACMRTTSHSIKQHSLPVNACPGQDGMADGLWCCMCMTQGPAAGCAVGPVQARAQAQATEALHARRQPQQLRAASTSISTHPSSTPAAAMVETAACM